MMRQRGFSLVELMISLALFGLIVSGAMSLVMSGARSQARSARVDVAQSGLRASVDFMSRDLLSASAGARSAAIVRNGAPITPIVITNSSTGADQLDIWTIDASVMATVTADVLGGSTSITVDSASAFKANDLVLLCDLASGTILPLTSASGTSLTSSEAVAFPTGISTYSKGSFVFRARHATYTVSSTAYGTLAGANAYTGALMLDLHDGNGAQPLAEGIEDLQVALGFDSNGDGLINENGAAANDDEWTYNHAGDSAPVSLTNLKAVRITMIAKSTVRESGTFPLRPKAEDHAAATAADGFFRRSLQTEIVVRNFNL